MTMQLLVVCLFSFICGQSSLASYLPAATTVADIKYTLITALHEAKATTVLFHGCENVPNRFPELQKEGLQITVVCKETCGTASVTDQLSTTVLPAGGQITVACDSGKAPPPHDAVVLDAHSCNENRHCSAAAIMRFMELAALGKSRLFAVIDYMLTTLSVVRFDNPNTSVRTYSEGGGSGEAPWFVFSHIYKSDRWGRGAKYGEGSGLGSSVEYTRNLRTALVPLLKKYNVSSMMDTPCGSLTWMPKVLEEMPPGFKYTGIDVACPVIKGHVRRFSNKPNWRFYCSDVCHQPLPQGVDLVFSRDALQHVPQEYAFAFLARVKASGAKFLLVGSYPTKTGVNDGNKDINIGDCYNINLQAAPFHVQPAPVEVLNENTEHEKHMLLLDVEKLTWNTDWKPDLTPGPRPFSNC